MKGQTLGILLFLVVTMVVMALFFGVINSIKASFKSAPKPPAILSIQDRQDQRDRVEDIQRRQKELMANQKQRMEDMRRMQQR